MFLRTGTSPSHCVYGYEIDEVLVKASPKWAKSYSLMDNHFEAMDVIAEELSDKCGSPSMHFFSGRVGGT